MKNRQGPYGTNENKIVIQHTPMGDNFWKPVGNRQFRTNPHRHHYQVCPYCSAKKKNIRLHYKLYHPETIEKLTGEVGELYGVRFFTSSNTDE